jgi:Tol biopolymer transport system component
MKEGKAMILTTMLMMGMQMAQAEQVEVPAEGHAINPVWSPDGRKVAFEINGQTGSIALFVANIEGGKSTGIPEKMALKVEQTSFGGSSGTVTAAPTWNPVNKALLFEGSHKGGSNRLYMYSFNGQPPYPVPESVISGDLSWPSFSADGMKLLFVSDETGMGDVYTLSLKDWKTKEQITNSEHSEMAPRFDASGNIVYTRKQNDAEDIFVHPGDANTARVKGGGDQTRPQPVGSSIVYFTSERGNDLWDIAISSSPGQSKTLAKDVRLPFRAAPALSPDGKWIAYGLENLDKADSIWLTKVDGSKTVAIKTPHKACSEPSLTQVGSKIYLAYTGLPSEGSNWRQLHIMDVTSKLQ